MDEIDAREFGKLEAEVAQLREIVSEIRIDMKHLMKNWDESKGGMRVLFGLSAVVGGFVTIFINWLLSKH